MRHVRAGIRGGLIAVALTAVLAVASYVLDPQEGSPYLVAGAIILAIPIFLVVGTLTGLTSVMVSEYRHPSVERRRDSPRRVFLSMVGAGVGFFVGAWLAGTMATQLQGSRGTADLVAVIGALLGLTIGGALVWRTLPAGPSPPGPSS